MSDLPAGWVWTNLAQVCTSITDGDHQPPPQAPEGIPFLVIGNIRNQVLDFTNCRYVSTHYFESLSLIRRPKKSDVLYTLVGSYGISVLVRDDRPFCVQRHIGIVRPSQEISASFLALALSTRAVLNQATKFATGTAQLTVPLSGLRRISIPLPPRPEQDRIVAAVEEQFSRLDAGVAALESVRRNLRRMRAAVLHAAVTGQLTSSHATANRASLDLPNWRHIVVGDIAEVSGGITKNPKRRPNNNPVPFLRVANVQRDCLTLDDVHNIEVFDGELERMRLRPGDLLVVEGNGSPDQIGRSALWHGEIDPCVHQNHLIRVRPGDSVLPEYLNLYWNAPTSMVTIQAAASSTSGLHTLSTGKVRSIPVALPPVETQMWIVDEVKRQLSFVDLLEAELHATAIRSQSLRSSILAAAFSGKLTREILADEPTGALLERIAAERATSNDHKPAGGRTPRAKVTA